MRLDEAKQILKNNGYILEKTQLDEGVLTVAAGVAIGLVALRVVGKVLGIGLKGLSSLAKSTNHKVIMKVLDRDSKIIGEELKEQLMNDDKIAEFIETKTITKKMIKDYIEQSTRKLIQPEYKYNALRMATDDVHDRQLKMRGFRGGRANDIGTVIEYHEKMNEIIDKLADITYDAIYEIKEEV